MFRLLLFFPFFIFANDVHILPDQAAQLISTLEQKLKKADNEVYIFTPYLDEYTIMRGLKKIAKNGVKVVIVTAKISNPRNRANYLSLFRNISVFSLTPLQNSALKDLIGLKGSFICIDNQEIFLLTDALETKSLKTNYSFAYNKEGACKEKFLTILDRAKSY